MPDESEVKSNCSLMPQSEWRECFGLPSSYPVEVECRCRHFVIKKAWTYRRVERGFVWFPECDYCFFPRFSTSAIRTSIPQKNQMAVAVIMPGLAHPSRHGSDPTCRRR